MAEELMYLYHKKSIDRKFDIYCSIIASIIIVTTITCYFICKKLFFCISFLCVPLTFILIYVHIIYTININIKDIFRFNLVFEKYREYREQSKAALVHDFLLKKNLLYKDKILFLIDYFKGKMNNNPKRDWISFFFGSMISIFVSSISGNEFNKDIFLFMFVVILFAIIIFAVIYFAIIKQYKLLFTNIFSYNFTINELYDLLSDIYLTLDDN